MIADETVETAAAVLRRFAGFRTTAATRARLESTLRERSMQHGLAIDTYVQRLSLDRHEIQELVDGLTVQETSFFRDPQHLDALVRTVLPAVGGAPVIWSAGCANGQEPYSIAMALDEAGIDDYRIIATDLSQRAIARAREGRYQDSELRGLSAARRGRYLTRDGSLWRIDDALRRRVTIEHHNLLTDAPPLGGRVATAVFCRNVFIYLERDQLHPFLLDLREHVAPGGALFVGGSETLWGAPEGWTIERIGGGFGYVRAGRGASVDRSPSMPPPVPARVDLPAAARPETAGADDSPSRREVIETEPALSAVEAHRRAIYLEPDDPVAHLELGLSLEAAGDHASSQRSFQAARTALDRSDRDDLEARLEGYGVDALRDLLDRKLGAESSCR